MDGYEMFIYLYYSFKRINIVLHIYKEIWDVGYKQHTIVT